MNDDQLDLELYFEMADSISIGGAVHKILLTILLLMVIHQGTCLAGDDCLEVDLRSELLGPAWNKGGVPFCNAYSGADLVSQRLGKKVSPLDMAFNLNREAWARAQENKDSFRETAIVGGSTVGAIERTQDAGGFCLESDFRSEASHTNIDLKGELNRIQEWVSKSAPGPENASATITNECKLQVALRELFPLIELSESIRLRLASSAYNILRNFQQEACKNRLPAKFKMKEFYDTKKTDTPKIISVIDEQLNKQNMATIYYDANFILKKPVPNAAHASTVVGRRKNSATNKCEYLIRNSWGACSLNDYPYACVDGNIWVPRDVMKIHALGYAYIE